MQEINDPFKHFLFFSRWKKRRCSWGSLRRVSSASISFTWKIWNRQSKVLQVLCALTFPSAHWFSSRPSDAVSDWKQKKQKRSQAVSLQSYKGLAEVAIRCICDLLVALPHFNFHNNIVVMVVPLMRDSVKKVSLLAIFAGKDSTFGDLLMVWMLWFVLRCLRCAVEPSANCWSRINWARPR